VVVSKYIAQYTYGRQCARHFTPKDTVEDSLARINRDIGGLLVVSDTEQMRARLQAEASG
jgi:hypothetical protein